MQKRLLLYPIIAGLFILTAFLPASAAQFAPAVFVIDQDVVDAMVKVTRVTANAPGWIVIHADDGGAPGAVLGQTAVASGIMADVVVEIDTTEITDTLWAMLHVDEGVAGEYEFPGADVPVIVNDTIVMDPFAIGDVAQSIAGLASTTEQFSTLVQALQAAGLVETLQSDGPFTVFAPTNDAFAAVPTETIDALFADPEQLTQVLLYHVIPGTVPAADVSDGMEAETAQGATVSFTVSDEGTVTINDATVTETDFVAYNGVIHVIDQVLLPPAPAEEVTEEAPAAEAAAASAEAAADEEDETVVTETETMTETAAMTETETMTETAAMTETETMTDSATMGDTPSVTVIDQGSSGINVAVIQTVAAQAGWMVIHADNNGAPGAVLGQANLPAGTTDNIIVTLDEPISGEMRLWAMLHVDEGEAGVYEFPGPDGPVTLDGAVVMQPFTAIVTGDEAVATPVPAEEPVATAVAAEEPVATAVPAEEPVATAVPAEEPVATVVAAEEPVATAVPAEEPVATAVPAEEPMADEAMAAPDMLPQTGFATGSATNHLPVVFLVMVALLGTAIVARRHER